MAIVLEKSKYVVGLDFGTTFSGFACAARSAEDRIILKDDWDCQEKLVGHAYCKTITASLYKNGKLEGWGWSSLFKYNKAIEASRISQIKGGIDTSTRDVDLGGMELLERFKLLLAPEGSNKRPIKLPKGLTAEKVITDYLEQVGDAALKHLQKNFGTFIQMEHVQWCLTGEQDSCVFFNEWCAGRISRRKSEVVFSLLRRGQRQWP
jgi:hypothetical protein